MSGSGASVGVIVVTVGEPCAAISERAKAAIDKLIVVTFEVVASKLIDDDDDDKLRVRVVSRRSPRERERKESNRESKQAQGESHRDASLHRGRLRPKRRTRTNVRNRRRFVYKRQSSQTGEE